SQSPPSPAIVPLAIEPSTPAAIPIDQASRTDWIRNENPLAEANHVARSFSWLKSQNSTDIKLDQDYNELLFVKNDIPNGNAYFALYDVEGQSPTIIVVP